MLVGVVLHTTSNYIRQTRQRPQGRWFSCPACRPEPSDINRHALTNGSRPNPIPPLRPIPSCRKECPVETARRARRLSAPDPSHRVRTDLPLIEIPNQIDFAYRCREGNRKGDCFIFLQAHRNCSRLSFSNSSTHQ